MKNSTTAQRIAAIVVAIPALAVAGVAQAATSRPATMSKAEYRALVVRSEALNQKYHLGQWQGVPQGMTPSEHRALVIRGEALNKQYGLGKWSKASATQSASPTNGFSWGAFGIGAVATFGLVLVGTGVVVGSRQRDNTARIRTS
jgi:hypothetical protein